MAYECGYELFRSCSVTLVHLRMLVLLSLVSLMSSSLTWMMQWQQSRLIICAYLMVKYYIFDPLID